MSRYYGLNQIKSIHQILKYALVMMLVISILIYGLVFFRATSITQIFNSENNQTLRIIASQGLKLYFLACPFAGFNIIISMYFTSVEHPLPAHMISLLRGFFVMIPTAFLLSWIGARIGVWCAFPIKKFRVSIIGVIFYLKWRRKKKTV